MLLFLPYWGGKDYRKFKENQGKDISLDFVRILF